MAALKKTKYNPQRKHEKVAGHKVTKGKKRGPMSQATKDKISAAKLAFYQSAAGKKLRAKLSSLAKAGKIGGFKKKHVAKKAAKGIRGHRKGLRGKVHARKHTRSRKHAHR